MDSQHLLSAAGREFLACTPWRGAQVELLTGDASLRRYYRLRKEGGSAILMDASRIAACVGPFYQIAAHLCRLGLSAPDVLAYDGPRGLMLLEDFGDATFTRLLDDPAQEERLYGLAIDVLAALHRRTDAIPRGLREYHPEKMLEDIELFLQWRTPGASEEARAEFRRAWRAVLVLAHQAPVSLLLRDYHVANLMLLPGRTGIRQAGLLDFQDAYQGPVTYDLVSLLQDARRDVSADLQDKMLARYLEQFPALDPTACAASLAILAALRHTRVLAIFERLSACEGKHEYKKLHSPRVERMLARALSHPALVEVQRWFERHAR